MAVDERLGSGTEYWKEGLEHAWQWFELHASQRIWLVGVFLVASAFMVAGFTLALLSKHLGIAVGIGVAGASLSVWFNLLEVRTRALVKAAEAALDALQVRLALETGLPELQLVRRVDTASPRWSSYAGVINALHFTAMLAWFAAAFYLENVLYGLTWPW